MPRSAELWTDAKEVAAYYNVNVRAVYRWCLDGRVKHEYTPGGRLRIAVTDEGRPLAALDE